jgi:hypothetical protein
MRGSFIVVLLLMRTATSAAQDRPLPELEPFIKEARERLQTDRTLQTNYTYVEKRREFKLDENGRAKAVSEKVFESYPGFPGEPRWERLIAEDGVPVPVEKLEAGDRGRQKKAESYARRLQDHPEQEHARQLRLQKEAREQANEVMADIFRVYEIRMLRRERVDDHQTIVFSLTPRRDPKTRTREGRDMHHFGVTAWVSESDFELVRVEMVAIHTVKMGLGVGLFARLHKGASLTFVRRKINDEVWLPAASIYEGSARLGLVKTVRQRGESEFTDYRKFTVNTQSSFVSPPVKP